ncbi:hypothetical protein CY34DRAFT_810246 [Suillus luteus UH-Slu-Lm8-n1]|uniref:Uncharacterized protein n=1 Tax=Suillus luteus UH-Slu-Lm8-n1 TaxID=930992 RepID=A0A0D0B0E5_9AGAM|nr:hypothetical protein CY34DRAFT_810246 [Suillus luteus UH-Slu-Lm8-n1]
MTKKGPRTPPGPRNDRHYVEAHMSSNINQCDGCSYNKRKNQKKSVRYSTTSTVTVRKQFLLSSTIAIITAVQQHQHYASPHLNYKDHTLQMSPPSHAHPDKASAN